MDPYAVQANVVLPPMTDGTAVSNADYFAATTAAANAAIVAGRAGSFWILQPVGDDIWVLFTSNAAAAATNVDKTKTARDKSLGIRLLNGVAYRFWIPRNAKFVSWQAQAANSVLHVVYTNAINAPTNTP